MKERPILFSGSMVRAIREGRKTQTRRLVKLPVKDPTTGGEVAGCELNGFLRNGEPVCPYGQPGDRLWVRETWSNGWISKPIQGDKLCYRATPLTEQGFKNCYRWRPSIHMPRWASRITLEIVSVRVERLKDISNDDCQAEGIKTSTGVGLIEGERCFDFPTGNGYSRIGWHAYKSLWESINGPGSWDLNPWVWVVEFKEVKP